MRKKGGINLVQLGVWIALALALAGSLRHVAWAFSTLEHGDLWAGYVQAVAVDVGLAVLALGIQVRRRQRRGTAVLWAGVAMFSAISVYANYLFGLVHQADVAAGPLASWRPLLLSAVLPVLVLYLAEVAGSDVNYSAQMQEKEERRQARSASATEGGDALLLAAQLARDAKAEKDRRTREEVMDAMLAAWREDPTLGPAAVARRVGRSRTTVYEYLNELERQGRVVRDNGSVRVLEDAP